MWVEPGGGVSDFHFNWGTDKSVVILLFKHRTVNVLNPYYMTLETWFFQPNGGHDVSGWFPVEKMAWEEIPQEPVLTFTSDSFLKQRLS